MVNTSQHVDDLEKIQWIWPSDPLKTSDGVYISLRMKFRTLMPYPFSKSNSQSSEFRRNILLDRSPNNLVSKICWISYPSLSQLGPICQHEMEAYLYRFSSSPLTLSPSHPLPSFPLPLSLHMNNKDALEREIENGREEKRKKARERGRDLHASLKPQEAPQASRLHLRHGDFKHSILSLS